MEANQKAEKPIPSRRSQVIGGLIISLVTLVLILGSLEITAYFWEQKTAQESNGWELVGSRRMPLERHGTDEQPYFLFVPDQDYHWEGNLVHINDSGFRTEPFSQEKPADTVRILNVGDSVAFGWEVNQDETYGEILVEMLNDVGDGRTYEVINAGIPGWNLRMERDFLLQEGFGYDPDIIILDLTLVNDVYGAGPAVSENPGLFEWLRDHTYAWPFLTTQMRFLLARQQGPEAIPVLNPPQNESAYYPIEADSPVWDRFWDDILAIYEVTEARGIPLILLAFPTAYQLSSAGHSEVPQQVLSNRAEAAGIPFVDLLERYRLVCDEAGGDACEGYENLLFADVWMHPNALGHQLAAEALLTEMP